MSNQSAEIEAEISVSYDSITDEEEALNNSTRAFYTRKDRLQGHSFIKKNLHKPATCHHCSDLLWGIIGTTAMVCEICNFLAHEKCLKVIVSPCTCIVPFLIKDPVPHCWSEIGHFKRKFCNVCRKRVDDLLALRCEICEYYTHYECLDFVSADCKQCATSSLVTCSIAGQCKRPKSATPSSLPSLVLPLSSTTAPPLSKSIPSDSFIVNNTDNSSQAISHSSHPTLPHLITKASTPTNSPEHQTVEGASPSLPQHSHHWREGNLPINAKCATCKKTCWSAECLTGMRCEWCGVTAHYACHKSLAGHCDFGVLREIILPPHCVSLPRTSLMVEQLIGMNKPQTDALIGNEFSSGGDSLEDSYSDRRSVKDKFEKDFDDYVRVYDGLARFQKHQCRYLSLGRNVSIQKVIELSLKAFQLPPDEFSDYCLVEINERDNLEHVLDDSQPFKSQLIYETRRPHIIVRTKEHYSERESIQVNCEPVGCCIDVCTNPVQVTISPDLSVNDAILIILRRLGLEQLGVDRFQLVEMILDRGLTERLMPSNELVADHLGRVRRESVRATRLTRYYLQPVEQVNEPSVSLFVGNLKKGLSQRLYERILLERLGPENKWDYIEVIYYDFGSIVLVYLNSDRADTAYHLLRQSFFEERPILAVILPQLLPNTLPDNIQPLLVLVNVKSGGCQGLELITSFRKLLNPHQVFNLNYGGPLPGLHCFRHLKKFKILVCGGDGTVGWALSCLDNVGQDAACPTPPMAILPLGTGNDLARVLRWGSGYSGTDEPLAILRDVVEAEKIRLDRWTVVIKPDEAEKDAHKKQLQLQAHSSNTNEDTSRIFVMNNYFGIGIDADINLDFQMAREENPAKFNSRIHNKSVYLKMGLRKMVNRTKCKDLHQNIVVEVDGKQLDLPPLEGIIILNILSWGAGANPWGVEKDDSFSIPTHYDGQLEVVGVTGVVHMGQIFSGLRTGNRLAQGGHIRITVKTEIPVQVDGEPWIQSPGQIVVLRSALKATMLKKRKRRKVNRRHTEPGLAAINDPSPGGDLVLPSDAIDSIDSASSRIFGASGPPPLQLDLYSSTPSDLKLIQLPQQRDATVNSHLAKSSPSIKVSSPPPLPLPPTSLDSTQSPASDDLNHQLSGLNLQSSSSIFNQRPRRYRGKMRFRFRSSKPSKHVDKTIKSTAVDVDASSSSSEPGPLIGPESGSIS